MQFFQQGKYRLALEFFRRVLKYLEQNSLYNGEPWLKVCRKYNEFNKQRIALTQNKLRQYEDCEKTLENIIGNQQKYQPNDPMIYQSYNNLFIHCLSTNLNKAVLLGKALLSESEKDKIPLAYQKQIIFNLGTAYLLKENYSDAKLRLRECLTSEPNSLLKGFALNNLAVASWWHKMPNLREFVTEEEEEQGVNTNANDDYSDDQIDDDFQYVIPLLKRSIKSIQSLNASEDNQLELLLDENTIIPKDYKINQEIQNFEQLSRQECGIPLLNITEFIFNTDAKKKIEAQFWFKYTLKFYEKNDATQMDRCLILLAWLCSSSKQNERAESLYRRTLQMIDGNDSYNKILCLQLYGTMLKRNPQRISEGEKLIAQAYALADELPSWSNKLVHVLIPDLDL